ncbi:glycosyltransferase [Microbacterium aurum]
MNAPTTGPHTALAPGQQRIGFVVSSLHGGGAEAVGRAWMNSFVEAGHTVHAIMVSDKPDSDLIDPRVVVHHDAVHGSHRAKVETVRMLVGEHDLQALVGLQSYPNLIAIAASKAKGPRDGNAARPTVVVTEHNLVSLGLPGSAVSHRAKIALAKRWYRRADAVTAPSHAVAAEMVAAFGVPGERSLVVANPALAKISDRTRPARTPGIQDGVQLILACRLVPQKRPALALHTARALRDRGIPVEVVSFGGGPLQEELTRLAGELGVQFTTNGWVEDWFTQFAPNAVVLLPSTREGFGNVLVEAAAFGVPSVAVSGAFGVADAIIPGITGALALTADPADVADAVMSASALTIGDVDGWLDRFTGASSARDLGRVLTQAAARRLPMTLTDPTASAAVPPGPHAEVARTILFVVPSLRGGGAEFVASTWMRSLAERGHRVHLVTVSADPADVDVPPGVTRHPLVTTAGFSAKVRRVRALFAVTEADVAVSLQGYANLILLAACRTRRPRPRIIVSERNVVTLGLPNAPIKQRISVALARRAYRHADHVVGISHAVAGELVGGFGIPGTRITVVPNPAAAKVDASRIHRRRSSDGRLQLVLPARLVPQKRPLLLIKTAAELLRRGIACEAVAYGDGPLRGEVAATAARLGVTYRHAGWDGDWFAHPAEGAVVLLPSAREGFGNVLVEAAAAGLPSVAVSGALGVADAIVPGITGELALTADPVDLADAVERARSLPLTDIDRWLDRFSAASSCRDLERVITLALAEVTR